MKNEWDKIWQRDINKILTIGPSVRTRLRLIHRLIECYGQTGGSFLDVGCGSGRLLTELFRTNKFSQMTGIDLSVTALDQARQLCPKCEFQVLDIEENRLEKKFDLITSLATLEVVSDDQRAIRNMAAMLKSNGYLILVVQYQKKYWGRLDQRRNYRRYEIPELSEKGSLCDLVLVETFSWGWPLYHIFYRFMSLAGDRYLSGDQKVGFWGWLGAKILYYLFFIDDLFIPLGKGRWLFTVFRKK